MTRRIMRSVWVIATVMFTVVFCERASATAQWSRKFGESCTTCHSAFPRLNYYGERFKRNGYQLPDAAEPDGDAQGKKALGDNLNIDQVRNLFGFRLNVDLVKWESNALIDSGAPVDKWSLGNTDWIQFFVAGSIFKNVSFFTEMEFKEHDFHYSWFMLGFHNLLESSLANIVVGNISPRDYGAYPNRLRIMGPIKGDVFGVKSSQGTNKAGNDEAALNSSGSRPGIQYYGYKGPFLAWAGISPGDNGKDGSIGSNANNKFHYWGGLRCEVTEAMESIFEGSAISVWGYHGTDTANFSGADVNDDGTVDPSYENDFSRYSVESNLRVKDFDLMAVYLMGTDDNWNLDASDTKIDFDGVSLVAGYMSALPSGTPLHFSVQYDKINSSDVSSLEKEYVTLASSVFPRDNVRMGIYAKIDTQNSGDEAKSKVFANIRTMF